jgi:hypothetical protein
MKRLYQIGLLILTGLSAQAQTYTINGTLTYESSSRGVKEYAKSVGALATLPDVKTVNGAGGEKKTTAEWHITNMEWIKDHCVVENAPIEKNYMGIFPEIANMALDEQPCVPMSWRLTEENNETVMHCYFRMPADEVTNLWLTSEETCIVDQETGAQYRIRRTEPDTYRKHFTLRAKKGDVVDLKIFFAPLAETTKEVRIYGLPNWEMMGAPVTISYQVSGKYTNVMTYDTVPQFHKPLLEKEHMSENKPYDLQNWNTWKVMNDAHLIKPLRDGTMALWRTPEATYVAVGYEQNWTTEYFNFDQRTTIIDQTGQQYKLRKVLGLPLDEMFFMKGNAGDYVAFLLEFDPLPLNVSTITYVEPDGEPFNAWGANWTGSVKPDISVQELRDNQRLFEYYPRVVVK